MSNVPKTGAETAWAGRDSKPNAFATPVVALEGNAFRGSPETPPRDAENGRTVVTVGSTATRLALTDAQRLREEKRAETKRRVLAAARYDNGLTRVQLAERFHCDYAAVAEWLAEAGITLAKRGAQ